MITHRDFAVIFDYIKEKTAISIVESNCNAVRRFVHKKTDNIMSITNYINLIDRNRMEFDELVKVITINETYFFREEKYYKLLDEVIFPEFKLKNIIPRIWSGAASTGEEPISLALLVQKHFGLDYIDEPIIATDIDILSMKNLEINSYSRNSVREDGEHFHSLIYNNSSINGNNISINKTVLDLIRTARLNLILDDFSKVLGRPPELICLCNVLIYMDSKDRESIIDKAVKVLAPNGYLLVSSSNTAFINHSELELVQKDNCFYFKKIERESDV